MIEFRGVWTGIIQKSWRGRVTDDRRSSEEGPETRCQAPAIGQEIYRATGVISEPLSKWPLMLANTRSAIA
jgi:hypothetical protein